MQTRVCARPGCAGQAAATLTYHYGSRTVWIDDLTPQPEPSQYDLCAQHVARTTVPIGWARDDRRSNVIPMRPRLAG